MRGKQPHEKTIQLALTDVDPIDPVNDPEEI
jgi:hypothetical protein